MLKYSCCSLSPLGVPHPISTLQSRDFTPCLCSVVPSGLCAFTSPLSHISIHFFCGIKNINDYPQFATINLADSLETLTFAPRLKFQCKMKLFVFTQRFPDEASCESYVKAQRERSGIVWKKCGCRKNYWDSHSKCWHCAKCGHETTLTADTVMHATTSIPSWGVLRGFKERNDRPDSKHRHR